MAVPSMTLLWTRDAEALLSKVPLFLRPLVRRRVEAEAVRLGRSIVNVAFVEALKRRQMGEGDVGRGVSAGADVPRAEAARADCEFLARLAGLYCGAHHAEAARAPVARKGHLGEFLPEEPILCCGDCTRALLHGMAMRVRCPYHPKPACRQCATPCHQPGYRAYLEAMMKWGMGGKG
jgi:hypothetical protein